MHFHMSAARLRCETHSLRTPPFMPRPSLILVVAVLSVFGLLASDVYLPAMPAMARAFGVADWQMPQTVSVYLLALAIAQLGYGPLSDRWGRKPVLIAGILLYIAGSLGCARADGFAPFLAWRALEAIGAAAGLVLGRAVIADTCDRTAAARVYSIVYPLVSLSPALAPAVGAHLAQRFGWRADFAFVAAFGAFALLLTLAYLPETRPAAPRADASAARAGFAAVLADRDFLRYTVIVCAIYAAWFIYLTQSPFLFTRLGVAPTTAGWLYLPLTGGIIAANLLSKRLLGRLPYDAIVGLGLASFALGAVAFVVCAALRVAHVAALVLPMLLVSVANGSSLSLAVPGAIGGRHGRPAIASGLVGCAQIGGASLAAFGVSAGFGTGQQVLAIAIALCAAIAAGAALLGAPRGARHARGQARA
jgi:MFS transporter, DHA1 family, multidrug resistance protein